MMLTSPKKTASLIIGSMMPKESDADPKEEGLKVCAEDILKAIETKDVQALVEALKQFYSMVDEDESEETPQPEGY